MSQVSQKKVEVTQAIQLTPLARMVIEPKGDVWRVEVFVWGLSIQWAEDANKVEAIRDCMSCLHDMASDCKKAAYKIEEEYFR